MFVSGASSFSKYVVIRLVKLVVLSSVVSRTVSVWLQASINSSGGCKLRVTIIQGVSLRQSLFERSSLSSSDKTLSKNEISVIPSICRSEEHTSELQSRFDLVCRL